MKFLKTYILAIKESYSFMEGLRGVKFWLSLPFVAGKIAYWNVKDMCGPDCKKKGHNLPLSSKRYNYDKTNGEWGRKTW